MTKTHWAISILVFLAAFLVAWNMQWLPFSWETYEAGLPIPWFSLKIALGIVLGAWALRLSDFALMYGSSLLVRDASANTHAAPQPSQKVETAAIPSTSDATARQARGVAIGVVAGMMLLLAVGGVVLLLAVRGPGSNQSASLSPTLPQEQSPAFSLSDELSKALPRANAERLEQLNRQLTPNAPVTTEPSWSTETSAQPKPERAYPSYDPANAQYTRSDVAALIGNRTCEKVRSDQKQFYAEREKEGRINSIALITEQSAVEAFACNPKLQTWPTENAP